MGGASSTFSACICGNTFLNINGNRYFHQKQLGEGGFSYVDLVEDRRSGEFRALKRIICHDLAAEKYALEEIKYCQQFQHPNVIPLIEHCIKKKANLSEMWLVFPYYKSGTLFDEYQKLKDLEKQMSPDRVLKLMKGICFGIQHFHHSTPPLAHRDLKPANVLLSDDDIPVIMDLGSMDVALTEVRDHRDARIIQDIAAERCTMPYRAPELFDAPVPSVIDEKVDIWSLGCVFYSLMYLEGPYDQVWLKKDSVALAVQSNRIRFPDVDPYPPSYRHLVKQLLTIDPNQRPDIDEVLSRLDKL